MSNRLMTGTPWIESPVYVVPDRAGMPVASVKSALAFILALTESLSTMLMRWILLKITPSRRHSGCTTIAPGMALRDRSVDGPKWPRSLAQGLPWASAMDCATRWSGTMKPAQVAGAE
jgi:hypothetical protein